MNSPADPDQQRYGGIPLADRKSARRARLLDATLQVLDTEGIAAVTVRRVCREAGLNNRYFYENFTGLDDLLDVMADRIVEEVGERAAALTATAPPTRVKQAITIMVSVLLDDPRLLRILRSAGESALAQRRDAMRLRAVALLRPYLLTAANAGGIADERMIDTAAHLLVGGWIETLWAFSTGELAISRTELIDQLASLFFGVARASTATDRAGPARGSD